MSIPQTIPNIKPHTTLRHPISWRKRINRFLVPGLFSVPYSYFQRHGVQHLSLWETNAQHSRTDAAEAQSLFHPFNTESSVSLVHSQLTLSFSLLMSVKWHLASCLMVAQKNHKPNDSTDSSKQQSKENGDFLQSANLFFSKHKKN